MVSDTLYPRDLGMAESYTASGPACNSLRVKMGFLTHRGDKFQCLGVACSWVSVRGDSVKTQHGINREGDSSKGKTSNWDVAAHRRAGPVLW